MEELIRTQMIGTQRSGSNLLRLLLGAAPDIVAPPSAHELRDFIPLVPSYEPLDVNRNAQRLIADLVHLVSLNALPWPPGWLDPVAVYNRLRGRTLGNAVLALYDHAAHASSAKVWVSKCLENVHYSSHLLETGIPLVFLHLIRDPRDVALSFRSAPIGPKDPTTIALHWLKDQQAAEVLRTKLPPASWIQVKYEDLVTRPLETLGVAFGRLAVDWDETVFDFYRRPDAERAADLSPLWTNLANPLTEGRANAFRRSGSDTSEFVQQVERLVGETMQIYGYQPIHALQQVTPSAEALAAARASDLALREQMRRNTAGRNQTVHTRREAFLERLRKTAARPDSPCA